MMQQIFKGLNLPEEVAGDLAIYRKVANGVIGVIDADGHLITKKKTWFRPMADRQFKKLKAALEGSDADFVIVHDNYIVVDFSELAYNLECICETIQEENLGVMDSPKGLLLFTKRGYVNQAEWFDEVYWALNGVTVEDLKLNLNLEEKTVSLSPNPENPDEAKWGKLYFAT